MVYLSTCRGSTEGHSVLRCDTILLVSHVPLFSSNLLRALSQYNLQNFCNASDTGVGFKSCGLHAQSSLKFWNVHLTY